MRRSGRVEDCKKVCYHAHVLVFCVMLLCCLGVCELGAPKKTYINTTRAETATINRRSTQREGAICGIEVHHL